jgi:hypothetical protein
MGPSRLRLCWSMSPIWSTTAGTSDFFTTSESRPVSCSKYIGAYPFTSGCRHSRRQGGLPAAWGHCCRPLTGHWCSPLIGMRYCHERWTGALCDDKNLVINSFVWRHKYDNNISKSYCIRKQIISQVGSYHASNKYDTISFGSSYTNVVQTNVWSFGSKHYFIYIRKLYFLLEQCWHKRILVAFYLKQSS